MRLVRGLCAFLIVLAGLVSVQAVEYSCAPAACEPGFTDNGISCSQGACTRNCTGLVCAGAWTEIDNDAPYFQQGSDAWHFADNSASVSSASNSSACYQFQYDPSQSSDAWTKIDINITDLDPSGDYDNCDVNAIAGWWESGKPSNPWYENLTDSASSLFGERYWGDVFDTNFDYFYIAARSRSDTDSADSSYLPPLFVNYSLYCAPTPTACDNLTEANYSKNCDTTCYGHTMYGYIYQSHDKSNSSNPTWIWWNKYVQDQNTCPANNVKSNWYSKINFKVFTTGTTQTTVLSSCNAPYVYGVKALPLNATLGDDVYCNYTYTHPLNYQEKDSYYQWFKNGADQSINQPTLGKGNLSVGDKWSCAVTPGDGLVNGTKAYGTNNITFLSTVSQISLYLDGQSAWNQEGYLASEATVLGLESDLQTALDTCEPDSEGFCNLTLSLSSNTIGTLNLSRLEVYYETMIVSPEPKVINAAAQPSIQGFGENVTLSATITDVNGTNDISSVRVEVSPPGGQKANYSMTNITSTLWNYHFKGYLNGTYNYTIRANDSSGLWGEASGTFVITASLEIKINTTTLVQGANQTVYLTWGGTGGVSEDRIDYYLNGSVYVADGLNAQDIGLNGTLPNNNDFASVAGWISATTNKCKYNSSIVHKGSLSIMCENDAETLISISNASFRGKVGGYVYFDSAGTSGNAGLGLLAVTSSGPYVGIQAYPGTSSNVYCYQVGACNIATMAVLWDQWVPVLLNFTASGVEFYYNGTLLHRETTSSGLESFKFLAHKNSGTARAYFDQIWMSSGDIPQAYSTQSAVTNNGTTNASVFLLMKVQYWNSSSWLDNTVVLDDASARKIPSGQLLNLSAIWPGWSTLNNSYGTGTYRAYVALTDENNSVLMNGNGAALEASESFTYAKLSASVSLTFNATSPQYYGSVIQAGCTVNTGDSSPVLYLNGTNITPGQPLLLGAGTYAFNCTHPETPAYEFASTNASFVILQAPSSVALYVNSTRANFTTEKDTSVLINATTLIGEGMIKLYANGALLNEGMPPLYNLTLFPTIGIVNVTAIHPETQNFTAGAETWFVNVIKDPVIQSVSVSPLLQGYGLNVTIAANATDFAGSSDIQTVIVEIETPSGGKQNISLGYAQGDIWQGTYSAFRNGTYGVTIYANDSRGSRDTLSGDSFVLASSLGMSLATEKQVYSRNEVVNLTNSSLSNLLSTSTSGQLLMKVEYWNVSGWVPQTIVLNDTGARTVLGSEALNLSAVWNTEAGGWHSSANAFGLGLYRASAAFTDPLDETLLNADGAEVLDSYNFTLCHDVDITAFTEIANTSTQRDWRMTLKNQENETLTNLTWNVTGWTPAFSSQIPFNLTANESITLMFNVSAGQEDATISGSVSSVCVADVKTLERSQ